ncbi:MAG: S8 family serine peptidase, partial [Acidimicrobiia bacterium]|nr:S8 family serine peptidase [Acidimicrobiia bacterium]
MRSVVLAAVIALAAPAAGIAASGPASAAPSTKPYIVVVTAGTSPTANAEAHGVTPTQVYTSALVGYAADLTKTQVKELRADTAIESVTADTTTVVDPGVVAVVPQPAQVTAVVVQRVGALASSTAKIDGIDERVDVDVAILDTGIDSTHPDLNVVGGFDCVNGTTIEDVMGHGTMVGGLVGAIDNSIGHVGVAPGARLWSIRVGTKNGSVHKSSLLCGIDWVTAHAGTIEVANLSLAVPEKISACDTKSTKPLHAAACASVAAGVTYVAAAGNEK